jgi:hypothetical protein
VCWRKHNHVTKRQYLMAQSNNARKMAPKLQSPAKTRTLVLKFFTP